MTVVVGDSCAPYCLPVFKELAQESESNLVAMLRRVSFLDYGMGPNPEQYEMHNEMVYEEILNLALIIVLISSWTNPQTNDENFYAIAGANYR